MTRKTRRILFGLAVLVFVVSVPIVVSYAQGYRFDFKRLTFTQVGAILLESKPKDAIIRINNKDTGKQTTAIIGNLLPSRSYKVSVQKDGFYTWQKELEVQPEKITTAKNIFLFPKELTLQVLELNEESLLLKYFSVSPDISSIFLQDVELNSYFFERETQNLTLIKFPDRLKTRAINQINWSENSDNVLFYRQTRLGLTWYVFNLSNKVLTNVTRLYEKTLFLNSPTEKPLPSSFRANELLFFNSIGSRLAAVVDKKILLLNIEEESLEVVNVEDVKKIATHSEKLFVFKEPDILLSTSGAREDITLWGNLRFIPDELSVSPDDKKLAYFHQYTVGVIWLENSREGPLKEQGQQDIILQPVNPIKKFSWHGSSEYIMVLLDNGEFIVAELDDRGGQNIWVWIIKDIVWFDYSTEENSLWLLKKDGVLLHHQGEF